MKKSNVLKILSLFLLVAFSATIFTSCDEDDDPEPNGNGDTDLIEDGLYVIGDGTALTEYGLDGLMKATTNEADDNADRASLMQLYVAVRSGADGFNISNVVGGTPTLMGPGDDFALVADSTKINNEPNGKIWRGSIAETETPFTVDEDGLYHVVYDTELGTVAVAKVDWGIVGPATPGGWTDDTALPSTGFDLNTMTFQATDIALSMKTMKFRYSGGWKIVLDGENVRVNTNYGGSIDALVPGGDDIAVAENGYYTVTMTWELGSGHTATLEKTADYTPPSFPDAMYLVGDATAYGWDEPGTTDAALMHKCAGGAPSEGIFWKIAHLEAGAGFKLSAAGWGDPNLGFAEVDEYDANGVTISDNGGNMSVETSGMYMIVVNLQDEMKKVSVIEAEVYGIGDAFGGSWDEDVAANKFTIDNTAKTLTSPALSADGAIRMYAQHEWIPDWWNAEFNVYEGVIEYRNDGGDQAEVLGTTGQVITLHFDDNTGTIE